MGRTNTSLASAALGNTLTRSGHAAVEIHSINTDRRVVLDTEIDMFADSETKVTSLGKVTLAELVFLNLQSTFQDFLGFRTTDSDVHGNLFVTTNTEGTDGVSGLAYEALSQAMWTEGNYCWLSYCRLAFDHSTVPAPSQLE
jgi:hypothetical protein